MKHKIRDSVRRARTAVLVALVAVSIAAVGAAPARAGFELVHVSFGTPIRSGANTVAFSNDGGLGFAAAYGYPERGDASNRVFSFDTSTGSIVDSAMLSGLNPRQVVYCDRNGYVAIRHDGPNLADPQAAIDVLVTNTGIKPGNDPLGTPIPGFFGRRISVGIWDPYAYLEGKLEPAQDALDDLAFSSDGRLLLYSNCGQMFGVNTQTALISNIEEINSRIDLAAGDLITFFSYTPATVLDGSGRRVPEVASHGGEVGYLSIGVSRNVVVRDDPSTPSVNEYRLYPNSRILNFKVWANDPDAKVPGAESRVVGATFLSQVDLVNDGITEGSNVVIDPNGRYGLVIGADTGNVYTFRVDSGAIRRVTPLDGFAVQPNDRFGRGPRRITVSPSGMIVISRPGNISRPTNVNISRPTNVNEGASVVLCQVTNRGRFVVVGQVTDFSDTSAISNVVFDGTSSFAYFTTTDGLLHALSVADTTVSTVADVGANAWSVALHVPTGRVGIVNGMQVDEAGGLLDAGGVTLGVLDHASKRTDSGVGSPVLLVPPSPTISRPYGTCVAGH